jgi:hypothetical protein
MYQRKLVRRVKGRKPQVVFQSMGDDYPACNSVVGSMVSGASCTLPDGSNIANWNGSQLVNPNNGPIDPANAAALAAAGWKPNQISGAGSGGSDSTGLGTKIGGAISSIFGSFFGPKPTAPTVIQSGPSTTELLLIGGAALAAVYLITKD